MFAVQAQAQGTLNLVNNGDFSSALTAYGIWAFSPWNVSWSSSAGNPGGCAVLTNPQSGPTILQNINGLIVGNIYTLSGDYQAVFSGGMPDGSGLHVSIDNADENYFGSSTWQTFSFNFIASSTSDLLVLQLLPNGDSSTYYNLDNISIVAYAVPEPSTCALFLFGLAGFLGCRKRLKNL